MPEDYFDACVKKPTSQLRLVHYPYDASEKDAQGIGAHTDYECFTILLPTAPGLEVMNAKGQWIDAPPVDGAFIVNIGDMLEIWTGGTFVATTHRVRSVNQERYSFPLFMACDYHTVVTPLPQFASEKVCEQYPAINAGAHLFAQTAQTFSYLMRRLASGDLILPKGSKPCCELWTRGEAFKTANQNHYSWRQLYNQIKIEITHMTSNAKIINPKSATITNLPVISILIGALFWGFCWWPLKFFADAGLSGNLIGMTAYAIVGLFAVPIVWRERHQWRSEAILLLLIGIFFLG